MKIIVISLARSVERRKRIEEQLDNAGLAFEFFDAIDASVENFKYSERRAPKKTQLRLGYRLIDAEIACFASHFSVWEKCIALDEPIVVLEDNCDITSLLASHLALLPALANEYQFVKLFSMYKKAYSHVQPISPSSEIVYFHERTCGTQGYVITPYAAQRFISNATQFIEPVDNYLEKPWRHGISTYSVKPNLVTRAEIKSTIGSKRKIKNRFAFWLKPGIEIIRAYEDLRYRMTNLHFKISTNKNKNLINEKS